MTQNPAGGGPQSFAGAIAQHQLNQGSTTVANTGQSVANTSGFMTIPNGSGMTFTNPQPDWAFHMPTPTRAERELAFLKTFIQQKEEIVWRKAYEAKWNSKPKPKKDIENLEELYRMVGVLEAEVRREKDTP